jgi:hypothetical protein
VVEKKQKRTQYQENLIAQWAFDTRPVLSRFHLWLEDVEIDWQLGEKSDEFVRDISFMDGRMERLFAVTGAITALGTQIFGGFGKGKGADRMGLNQAKKEADAISAYAMSESLWFASRLLPENHAIMVCLGEGLMPKAGETPEMGSNPQLGFGRIYARPEVARWLDHRIHRLLNDRKYTWSHFYQEIKTAGITVWGTAIDTLENTSRFSKGAESGPMTVMHLFNQPLRITKPYEGYVGNLILPRRVVDSANSRSLLITFKTPRRLVVEAIEQTYPGIRRENIHVWTIGGPSRVHRIGGLWQEWQEMGAHVVEDGWRLPSGQKTFNESGTYAPTFSVGDWLDEQGDRHLFICDGYAASAEAVQAATLAPLLDLEVFLSIFTSTFELPYHQEREIMGLDPDAKDFARQLERVLGHQPDQATLARYGTLIHQGRDADIPLNKPFLAADDFFPEKEWDALSVCGFMGPDPYSAQPGVEELGNNSYRVTVRLASLRGIKLVRFTFKLKDDSAESRLVFSPLLSRFMSGENYQDRPVKISDSGRIRNELQTICSEALEFVDDTIILHLDRIPEEVISGKMQKKLKEILSWYRKEHPIWFRWLKLS